MDIETMLLELKAERALVDGAIAALARLQTGTESGRKRLVPRFSRERTGQGKQSSRRERSNLRAFVNVPSTTRTELGPSRRKLLPNLRPIQIANGTKGRR